MFITMVMLVLQTVVTVCIIPGAQSKGIRGEVVSAGCAWGQEAAGADWMLYFSQISLFPNPTYDSSAFSPAIVPPTIPRNDDSSFMVPAAASLSEASPDQTKMRTVFLS